MFYSFEVLISTIEPWSISSMGPMVVKISSILCFGSVKIDWVDSATVWRWLGAQIWSGEIKIVDYLHHYWSVGADTLQFDSTNEYFKTVEYEPHRMLQLWDIIWKRLHLWRKFTQPQHLQPLSHRNQRICRLVNFKWTYLGAQMEFGSVLGLGYK